MIDDNQIRERAESALEFHLVKRPQVEARVRIPDDQTVGSLGPVELLDIYWKSIHLDAGERQDMNHLAEDIFSSVLSGNDE